MNKINSNDRAIQNDKDKLLLDKPQMQTNTSKKKVDSHRY